MRRFVSVMLLLLAAAGAFASTVYLWTPDGNKETYYDVNVHRALGGLVVFTTREGKEISFSGVYKTVD